MAINTTAMIEAALLEKPVSVLGTEHRSSQTGILSLATTRPPGLCCERVCSTSTSTPRLSSPSCFFAAHGVRVEALAASAEPLSAFARLAG
jgi:hypothetical protein